MKRIKNFSKSFFCVVLLSTLILTSCRKPYQEQIYKEIGNNVTAFVVPLEQDTKNGQKRFKSIEYLEQKKIAAKRIYIPTIWHQTGRYEHEGRWIEAAKVIEVDRTPVTREWTSEEGTGSSSKNQGITVESKNSIGFTLSVAATGNIEEENAAAFLYYFNGRSLAEVMDNIVRPHVGVSLTNEFGGKDLTACQNERKEVYERVIKETKEYFAQYGLTISNLGVIGQFQYVDNAIQEAINLEFIAKKKNDAAVNDVAAARKYAEAAEAIKGQKRLDAEINLTNSLAEAIRGGKMTWPSTLVVGKDMSIMDIYGAKNMSKENK